MKRRAFINFITSAAVGTAIAPHLAISSPFQRKTSSAPFGIKPSSEDALLLPEGVEYRVFAKWGDALFNDGLTFGFNNDFIAIQPVPEKDGEFFLWVNHETANPKFVSRYKGGDKQKDQVDLEMQAVGGSILHIIQEGDGYVINTKSPYNRRIHAQTPIPFAWNEPVYDHREALGTLANCAGGTTDWGTFLTCEENYNYFWGERIMSEDGQYAEIVPARNQWDSYYEALPEHFGWVTEINPISGEAKKLVGLGRFSHECATFARTKEGFPVVYSGDDANDQCLYKFIANQRDSLESGTLYVANLDKGRWEPIDIEIDSRLSKRFPSQLEVLLRCRESAQIVGGTPLNRPEDIEIHPKTKDVFVSLTNNVPKGDLYGSILKIQEEDNDHGSLTFKHETFMAGGDTGFANPDNLMFDKKGNLWVTTDMSGSVMNEGEYAKFGNNGLFYIPMSGDYAGEVIQIASAPTDAEFTGPCLAPNNRGIFLSVQHPGSGSKSISAKDLTSNFPEGGNAMPRPAVVFIQGPLLDELLN